MLFVHPPGLRLELRAPGIISPGASMSAVYRFARESSLRLWICPSTPAENGRYRSIGSRTPEGRSLFSQRVRQKGKYFHSISTIAILLWGYRER